MHVIPSLPCAESHQGKALISHRIDEEHKDIQVW